MLGLGLMMAVPASAQYVIVQPYQPIYFRPCYTVLVPVNSYQLVTVWNGYGYSYQYQLVTQYVYQTVCY